MNEQQEAALIEQLKQLSELNDENVLKAASLAFAKMAIFNPRTLNDWVSEQEDLVKGIPKTGTNWFIEKSNLTNDWVLRAVKRNLTDVKRLSSSRKYKSFTQHFIRTRLSLTLHAIKRFKERSLITHLEPEWIWDIPLLDEWCDHLPGINIATKKQRKDCLMPFKHGAFLGAVVHQIDAEALIRFRRGKAPEADDRGKSGFVAMTYVGDDQLRVEQRAVCDAVTAGEYDEAAALLNAIAEADVFDYTERGIDVFKETTK